MVYFGVILVDSVCILMQSVKFSKRMIYLTGTKTARQLRFLKKVLE